MIIHERQSAVSKNCMLINSLDKFTLSTVLSLYLDVEVPSYDEINGIILVLSACIRHIGFIHAVQYQLGLRKTLCSNVQMSLFIRIYYVLLIK